MRILDNVLSTVERMTYTDMYACACISGCLRAYTYLREHVLGACARARSMFIIAVHTNIGKIVYENQENYLVVKTTAFYTVHRRLVRPFTTEFNIIMTGVVRIREL